jgi:uncharacterized RDD family membrane protein YckC
VTEYAGLATRTVAFALDAAIINVVVWAVAAIVALGLSLLKVPDTVITVLAVIGAGIAIVWSVAYFAFFWSSTGQTPGNRLLGIQVVEARSAEPPHVGRAVLRVLALPLAALPLCAGFLMILVDRERRALQDHLVRTRVIYVREPELVTARVPAASASAKALH